MVGFVYFLSDFSRSRSSGLKTFCKKKNCFSKILELKGKHLCQSSFKVAECFKKDTLAMSFSVNFTKSLKNVLQKLCFLEPVRRFASEIAKFQVTLSPFLKEAVVFNCLSIKNNKIWYFPIHSSLIFLKMMLTKCIFDFHPIPEKKPNRGS